jgi:hypothetical protein
MRWIASSQLFCAYSEGSPDRPDHSLQKGDMFHKRDPLQKARCHAGNPANLEIGPVYPWLLSPSSEQYLKRLPFAHVNRLFPVSGLRVQHGMYHPRRLGVTSIELSADIDPARPMLRLSPVQTTDNSSLKLAKNGSIHAKRPRTRTIPSIGKDDGGIDQKRLTLTNNDNLQSQD